MGPPAPKADWALPGGAQAPQGVSKEPGDPSKEQMGGLSPTSGPLPGPCSSRAPFPTLSGSLCPALGQPLALPGQQDLGSSILRVGCSILWVPGLPTWLTFAWVQTTLGGAARGCLHPQSHGWQAERCSGSDRVNAAC